MKELKQKVEELTIYLREKLAKANEKLKVIEKTEKEKIKQEPLQSS